MRFPPELSRGNLTARRMGGQSRRAHMAFSCAVRYARGSMSHDRLAATAPFWTHALRGLAGRCPKCGQGRLFARYLKQVDRCAVCGEDWGHIRADDGPAWLTILVVGHLVVGTVLSVEPYVDWPQWFSTTLWVSLALGLTLLGLPRAKGLFIALIWRHRMPGSERDG